MECKSKGTIKGSCLDNQISTKKYAKIVHILVLYKIWRHFYMYDIGFYGLTNSNNAINFFSASKRHCHGNQMWAKINQNCTDFVQFCAR